MDKPLWGLRVQGVVLSSIPVVACACGAEGHMASIGPLALGAKGCVERLHRFAQGAADWRSGPRWSILSVLCLVHPLPLRGVPLKGKREVWEEKQRVIYFMYHSAFSLFGGERSELITRMLIMPYGTESKSRNADFIFIALRAIPQPSARRAVKLKNPWAEGPSILRTLTPRVCPRPVHLKNLFPQPFSTTLFHNPPPTGGHNPRGAAPSTLPFEPFEPSHQRCVQFL